MITRKPEAPRELRDAHDSEIEHAVSAYRDALSGAAEVAGRDLDEIEDHMRALIDDLRATGMPAVDAVAEAARRLGQPRALAREHTRVRTAFGTKLPSARAWSVALLLIPAVVWAYVNSSHVPVWSRYTLECSVDILLAVALVARVSWARAALLGMIGFRAAHITALVSAFSLDGGVLVAAWGVALVAFLLPWRRHELSAAGAVVALATWSYSAVSLVAGYELVDYDGHVFHTVSPVAVAACVLAAVTVAGTLLRARWGAIACAVVGLLLALTTVVGIAMPDSNVELTWYAINSVLIGTGACAALAGAVIGWRSARSRFGSLRSLVA